MATIIYSLVCLSISKKPESPCRYSELRRFSGFELELQFVRNQGDELRIGGFAFGVAHGVAEEALYEMRNEGISTLRAVKSVWIIISAFDYLTVSKKMEAIPKIVQISHLFYCGFINDY